MRHTINLDPAAEYLDGKQLDQLLQLYVDRLSRRTDLDSRTVSGYKNKLQYFRNWWADVGPWCNWELSREKLRQYNTWLSTIYSQYNQPLAWGSRHDALRRLRQCLGWAFEHDYLSRDIRAWVPAAEGVQTISRQRASLEQLSALMQAAGQGANPIRDQAFCALLIGTGVRKMEGVGLNCSDIRMHADSSGTAVVRNAKRVRGRLVQGRIVAFDRWTGTYLRALLDSYGVSSQTLPLFRVPNTTTRIGDMGAYRIVKRAVRRAGLDDIIEGPHDLRRNFATWFSVKNRGELHARLLSKQLGHSSFSQTNDYILHDAEDLKGVIRSPLAVDESPAKNIGKGNR